MLTIWNRQAVATALLLRAQQRLAASRGLLLDRLQSLALGLPPLVAFPVHLHRGLLSPLSDRQHLAA